MTYRVADLIADSLQAHDLTRAFSVPGESFLPLLDALYGRSGFDLVTCRHEGSAALAAVADARLSGQPGVIMCSRGPGLSNAAIGIHVAAQEALPLLVLVGQVDMPNLGRDAVQEVAAATMFGTEVKWTARISLPEQAAEIMARACAVSQSGTPGPVIVEMPEDVLTLVADPTYVPVFGVAAPETSRETAEQAAAMMAEAKCPLLIVGTESVSAEFRANLLRLSEAWDIPVLVTNKNQDIFPNDHPHWAGQLGFFPSPVHASLCEQSDLIIAVGTRLGETSSLGFSVPRQRHSSQPLIHVYPDGNAMGRHFTASLAVVSTAASFLSRLLECKVVVKERSEWLAQVWRARLQTNGWIPDKTPEADVWGHTLNAVSRHMSHQAIVTGDSGNFVLWVPRALNLQPTNRLLSSACGAMGMGVPAGIAAALREPEREVIAFCGDGGFLMNGNELATAVGRGLNIKIFVLNNGIYGTIRTFQERAFPARPSGTELSNPDFKRLAEAYGAVGYAIDDATQSDTIVRAALSHIGPVLVEVRVPSTHSIQPSLAAMFG